MTCRECGVPLQSWSSWIRGERKPGHKAHAGRGLCRQHYEAALRREGPIQKQRSREEVLEEYALIKDSVSDVRQAAERMGMSFAALNQALYRARLDGVDVAMPPLSQLLSARAGAFTHQEAS